jgi:hypothetical protein
MLGNFFSFLWSLQIFPFCYGKEAPSSVQRCLEGKSSENKQHDCLWVLIQWVVILEPVLMLFSRIL